MKLFIDTSIFLPFYSNPTPEGPKKLKQLVVLAENGKVDLLLPQQVVDEIHRDRAKMINNSFFKKAREAKLSLWVPEYCTQHERYSSMQDCQRKLEEIHREIVSDLRKDIESRKLPSDSLLPELFRLASELHSDPQFVESARQRIELGNPPGTKDSLGDAVIWESLLAGTQIGEDLRFVSKDRGFCSPLDKNSFNEFLLQEWTGEKQSKLFFYQDLREFFKEEFPEIELQPEADWEKNLLIQSLAESSSFVTTHYFIAKLSDYDFFTQEQVENMVDALFANNQISWIIGDPDVKRFYQDLYNCHFLSLPQDKERKLITLLMGVVPEDPGEVPF